MPAIRIVHIYVESVHVQAGIYQRLGALKALVPKSVVNNYIHKRHFPNNVLHDLQAQGDIRYRSHLLPFQNAYTERDAARIPKADVWLFSLLNHADSIAFQEDFFDCVRTRARAHGIALINLSSHIDDGRLTLQQPLPEYPKLVKLRANGAVGDYNAGSYAVLEDAEAETRWRAEHEKDNQRYLMQNWLGDQRNHKQSGLYVIERWLHIDGDLTIGLRYANNPIVKQFNSVTSYLRDARLLGSQNEFELMNSFLQKQTMRHGSMPLSFCYHRDDAFWDRRYAQLGALQDKTGFQIGSLDAILLDNDELVIFDYNEHTLETAHDDLRALWAKAMLASINKAQEC